MRRFRTPSRRAVLLGVATLVVLVCVGLFVRAYRNAGAGDPQAGGGFGAGASGPPVASPTPTATAQRHSGRAAAEGVGLPTTLTHPRVTFTAAGGPGFTIVPAPRHKLVLAARSAAPIGEVGYLVPTSTNHNYGTAKHVGNHWVLRTSVTGKPYYAAIFIQAGATGTRITCTITLDGKVVASRSTSGPYGRQVCVA